MPSSSAEHVVAEFDVRTIRRTQRCLHAAGFPRSKRLDEFGFAANPLNPALIGQLVTSDWFRQARPLYLIGEAGTGETGLRVVVRGPGHLRRFWLCGVPRLRFLPDPTLGLQH